LRALSQQIGLAAMTALAAPLICTVAAAQPRASSAAPSPAEGNAMSTARGPGSQRMSAAGGQRFDSADVFVSGPNTIPGVRSAFIDGQYELRDATLVDLISTAWNVQNVLGGPRWIDTERFDVISRTRADATPGMLRSMLQGLLTERFGLALHSRQEDELAYVMTAGDKAVLRRETGAAPTGCEISPSAGHPNPPGFPQPAITLDCHNMTVAAFAQALPGIREMSGYLFGYPVLDRTALQGPWSFKLTFSPRNAWHADAVAAPGTTLFDALEQQLGLRLDLQRIPGAIVVVDTASEPGATPAPRGATRFADAQIRRGDANDADLPCGHIDIRPGGQVRINMTLRNMLLETQGDFNTHRIDGGPYSLDASCWLVQAQAPVARNAALGWNGPLWNGVDVDSMRTMLRSLLTDHFDLQAHTEDRPIEGYELIATNSRLRRSGPSSRGGCHEGPGPERDFADPRLANPLASRLISCRNVTLAEFAQALDRFNTGAGGPVVDATGIDERVDISINFSPGAWFRGADSAPTNGRSPPAGPGHVISIFEALSTQLGLELHPATVYTPVLIIDQVRETPR
jgi:uncharacterized protein (TIGR03435 family)